MGLALLQIRTVITRVGLRHVDLLVDIGRSVDLESPKEQRN